MAVPVITIDENGILVPTYEDILTYMKDAMKAIYGTDLYLEPDSQDGQFIGIFAEAVNSAFQSAQAVYSAFSPATAQGTGLSNAVKINGLARLVPGHSIVNLLVSGDVGTVIVNGVATDVNNVRWILQDFIIIPGGGSITVGATAELAGATQAPANTITIIGTPTKGWFTVNNASAALPGQPVETDAQLRIRQSVSTELPSQALLAGMLGALLAVSGVTFAVIYENDTNSTDANGLPAHSISAVVVGGLDTDVGNAIYLKKTPGCYTYGSTSVVIAGPHGATNTIRWYRPTDVPVKIEITVQALTNYNTVVGNEIIAALVAYINALNPGDDIYWGRLFPPASLAAPDGNTYDITLMRLAKVANAFGTANLTIAFNEKASLITANVTLIVV